MKKVKRRLSFLMQFILYDLVSITTFVIDLLIVWLLTQFVGFHYLISVTIGLTVCVLLLYTAGRKFVYVGTKQGVEKGYFVCLTIAFLSLLAILGLMLLFVEVFGINYILARIIVGMIVGTADYIADTHFTFGMHFLPKKLTL